MKAKDYKAVLLDLLIKYGVQATSARTTTNKLTDTKTVAYRVCGADKDVGDIFEESYHMPHRAFDVSLTVPHNAAWDEYKITAEGLEK